MAGSFVKSFKRDCVYLADVRTADEFLAQLSAWLDDSQVRPHKGLKMLSSMEYREINLARWDVRFSGGNSSLAGVSRLMGSLNILGGVEVGAISTLARASRLTLAADLMRLRTGRVRVRATPETALPKSPGSPGSNRFRGGEQPL